MTLSFSSLLIIELDREETYIYNESVCVWEREGERLINKLKLNYDTLK